VNVEAGQVPGQVYNGQVRLSTLQQRLQLRLQLVVETRAQKSQKIKNNCQHRATDDDSERCVWCDYIEFLIRVGQKGQKDGTLRRCGDIDRSILMETRFI